ncbi:carbonic anhydrase [Pseudovirgaria hyperparasitica]|uniref:Carbonic anhydrase n=1 Tax=Pseudovirgaria hyperparasitica TaxID=470096 RepID=A0A6A6VWE3_9PEZI|nr:carbonic anhydrase [Pseudovirgaria hyperparasitica]KAF2753960.1 carbonic anhydrase [Pseudovirgaria hyperparasitica]
MSSLALGLGSRTAPLRCSVISPRSLRFPISSQRQWQWHQTANCSSNSSDSIERAINGNRSFAQRFKNEKPDLLKELIAGQHPEMLWIGCADSRVPETTICGSEPGDIFVHRNIANCLHENDVNSASVIEYSVAFLKVKKIMLCGHTKCGGAVASLGDDDLGDTLNTWLTPIREIRRKHQAELDKIENPDDRAVRLAELNVHRGIEVLLANPTVQTAMKERGLTVHGAIYDIAEAELRVLDTPQ